MKQVLADYWWFCDFGGGRRLLHALGGLALLGLGTLAVWGAGCALATTPLAPLLLGLAGWAWRRAKYLY